MITTTTIALGRKNLRTVKSTNNLLLSLEVFRPDRNKFIKEGNASPRSMSDWTQ